jgi:hypothetical protein
MSLIARAGECFGWLGSQGLRSEIRHTWEASTICAGPLSGRSRRDLSPRPLASTNCQPLTSRVVSSEAPEARLNKGGDPAGVGNEEREV